MQIELCNRRGRSAPVLVAECKPRASCDRARDKQKVTWALLLMETADEVKNENASLAINSVDAR
jgi:hypothetical protein